VCRRVPATLAQGISLDDGLRTDSPIDVGRATEQHGTYLEALSKAILGGEGGGGSGDGAILLLDADDAHPDSVFVEDTCVMVNPKLAVSTSIGTESRRGEEAAVAAAVSSLGVHRIVLMAQAIEGAHLDGGDVLFTGAHCFVGLSARTNELGLQVLRESFPSHIPVIGVPCVDNLHFKCAMTVAAEDTLVAADTEASRSMVRAALAAAEEADGGSSSGSGRYKVHMVESEAAANVLRVNGTLMVPAGVGSETQEVYRQIARNDPLLDAIVEIHNSEFEKIDGALTCRSVLMWE